MAIDTSRCFGEFISFVYGAQGSQDDTDWVGDTIRGILLDVATSPDFSAHHELTDISGGRAAGSSDVVLQNCEKDIVSNSVQFDADDITFASVSSADTLGGVGIYKSRANATTDHQLICIDKFSSSLKLTSDTDVNVIFNASGVWKIDF